MTRAMILCAGLGTRLGALSDLRPKPMLPVCDIPILHFGIANLVGHGIRDLVINVHHRGDVIEDEIGDGAALGARIQYSREDPILGTGGGLKHALPLLDPDGTDEPFISVNGKLIFDVDFTALLAAFRPAMVGMMVVRRVPDAKAWGAVLVQGGLVKNVLGDGEHMFCGVHVTRPSVMARLPAGESDSIRQGYLPWMHAGEEVGAFEHERGYFAEHSTAARYLASNLAFLRGETLRHPPGPLTGIDPTAEIDPTATIVPPVRIGPRATIAAGAVVGPDVVVGTEAVVVPGTRLTRAVIWAESLAAGDLADVVVTPQTIQNC